jgi:protein-L-isoaspartate(D-aspartate) O-methyltransferase
MLVELAREQMIEQQVRAWDVLDERILQTLRVVPRERFVPRGWSKLAFADCEIPLPHGKRMLRPMLVGRILQALNVKKGERVLEIGTGSGYVSACLARLGGQVRTLELHEDIAQAARANLESATPGLTIEVLTADGMQLSEEGQYDVIVLTASLPLYQPQFERALRPAGRLFAVIGAQVPQQASLVRRLGPRDWSNDVLFETVLEVLEHAPRPPQFGF